MDSSFFQQTISHIPKFARNVYAHLCSTLSSKEKTPPIDEIEGNGEKKFMSEWTTNASDKSLLRDTWSDDFETLYTLGSDIYIYIFTVNTSCKSLFPWISKYEEEGKDFKDVREFRSQALRFVQTIAHVVKTVYDMERLEGFLYDIGQRHIQYESRGFKSQYWDVFQDAMEVALTNRMKHLPNLSDDNRERAILIWRDIALYIIIHMKNGFKDGLKGINRYPNGIII